MKHLIDALDDIPSHAFGRSESLKRLEAQVAEDERRHKARDMAKELFGIEFPPFADQNYPSDILEIASEVVRLIEGKRWHDVEMIIARYLVAERQRCMRKVNEETNGATDEAVLISALAIQRAIAGEA